MDSIDLTPPQATRYSMQIFWCFVGSNKNKGLMYNRVKIYRYVDCGSMCLFVSVWVFYVSIGGGKTGYRWGTRDLATLINLTGNQHQTTRSGVESAKERGGMNHRKRKGLWLQKGSAEKKAFSRHIAAFARSIFVDRNHVAGLFIFRCQSGSRSDMEIGIRRFFVNRKISIHFLNNLPK